MPEGLGFPNLLGGASPVPRASYQVRWFPEADVHGQTSSLGWVSQDFKASTPIWTGDKSVLSLNAGVSNQLFQGSAVLPVSNTPIPDTLWNVRLGLGYQQTFANEWTMGLSASLVSASDQPFGGTDEIKVGAQAMLRIPVREHDAWILSLTYSPTSQIAFPIPGVAYQWVPSEQFQMLIGLPTAVLYRPTEDLSFSLTWMPITNVRARATYRISPGVRLYVGYEAANDSYYLADRTDNQDRLFEYDQRVSGGVQYSPVPLPISPIDRAATTSISDSCRSPNTTGAERVERKQGRRHGGSDNAQTATCTWRCRRPPGGLVRRLFVPRRYFFAEAETSRAGAEAGDGHWADAVGFGAQNPWRISFGENEKPAAVTSHHVIGHWTLPRPAGERYFSKLRWASRSSWLLDMDSKSGIRRWDREATPVCLQFDRMENRWQLANATERREPHPLGLAIIGRGP